MNASCAVHAVRPRACLHAPAYTGLGERVGPRLRESRLVASSGRGGEFPQPRARYFAQPCIVKCTFDTLAGKATYFLARMHMALKLQKQARAAPLWSILALHID